MLGIKGAKQGVIQLGQNQRDWVALSFLKNWDVSFASHFGLNWEKLGCCHFLELKSQKTRGHLGEASLPSSERIPKTRGLL